MLTPSKALRCPLLLTLSSGSESCPSYDYAQISRVMSINIDLALLPVLVGSKTPNMQQLLSPIINTDFDCDCP